MAEAGVFTTFALGVFAVGFSAAPAFRLPFADGFAVPAEAEARLVSVAFAVARAFDAAGRLTVSPAFCVDLGVAAVAFDVAAGVDLAVDALGVVAVDRLVFSAALAVAFFKFSADKRFTFVCGNDERDDVIMLNAGRCCACLSVGDGVIAAVRETAVFLGAAAGAAATDPTDFLGLDGL